MHLTQERSMKRKTDWGDLFPLRVMTSSEALTPEKILEKRHHHRMKVDDLSALLNAKDIPVKIITDQEINTDRLLNLSEGGMAVTMHTELAIDLAVKVSFVLGKKNIIVDAVIKQIRKKGSVYEAGIMFINLAKDAMDYINGIVGIGIFFGYQNLDFADPVGNKFSLKFVL